MQLGQADNGRSFPFVAVGKAVATTVITALCVGVLPLVPPLLVPILPLPAAYVLALGGWKPATTVIFVSTLLIYLAGGPALAVFVCLLLAGLSLGLGFAVRCGWSFERSLGVASAGVCGALVLWGLFVWQALGVGASQLRESLNASIDAVGARYAEVGMSEETVEVVTGQIREVASVVGYLAPGLVGMGSVLFAACCLGLAYALFPRTRARIKPVYALSEFRLHWAVAYVTILGLVLLLVAVGRGSWGNVATYVGVDLLLVSQTLFFLQGLAVIHALTTRRGMKRSIRTVLYGAAVVGQLLTQLTGLFGLLDTWFDYRRRLAFGSPGAGQVG